MPDWKPEILKRLEGAKLAPARESEIVEELAQHLEDCYREMIAGGATEEEARRAALEELLDEESLERGLRSVERPVSPGPIALGGSGRKRWLASLGQDLRYGLRMLRTKPGFSAIAVLTLALGIGANSAVFSAIDAVVLRPLPFPDGDQLMELQQSNPRAKGNGIFVASIRLEDWNRMSSSFQAVSGYYTEDESETSGALPERLTRATVAPRFLGVLGVSPELGRDFSREEEHFGGPSAVLISDRLWQRSFGGDPNVVGKNLRFGSAARTVIGVMPASFRFPNRDVDVWAVGAPDAPFAQDRESTWYTTIGRLKTGVSLAQARADLRAVQSQLGKQFPKPDADLTVDVEPLKSTLVGSASGTLWLLFGAVSLLLLIVCTNIAALLLARGAERRQEITIRCALGASRARIAAQLLAEVFVLAVAGAVLGLLIAGGAAEAFRALAANLPRVNEIRLDGWIVAYSLACALAVTFTCGLVPALRVSKLGLSQSMAHGSRTQVSRRNPWHWLLVGAQVTLAVTLLNGAGLLLRSFQALGRVSPGFDVHDVLALHITGGWGETVDQKALAQRIDRTIETLRDVPGVQGAATSATLPGVPAGYEGELRLTPSPATGDAKLAVESRFVSPSYFATMRIPLLAGELCRVTPGARGVLGAMVNRSFAETYLQGAAALGHRLESGGSFPLSGDVAGVVGDARETGINHPPVPTVYWCVSSPNPDPNYLIRTAGPPMDMAETLRLKIHEIEPGRSVFDVMTLEEHLGEAFSENRLRTLLISLFAGCAIFLACIGLYGTLSHFVDVRRREVGLRLALGATPGGIVKRFLGQGMRIAVLGCLIGSGLSAVTARFLAGMLYGVTPFDVTTHSGVILLVLAVAAGASLVPAVRAARVEPMEVLRDE